MSVPGPPDDDADRSSFNNNMYKNGSLPVVVSEAKIVDLLADARAGLELEIDLPAQVVRRSNGETIAFEVESFRKHCLVNGLDDISLTLVHESKISAFEQRRTQDFPWLDGIGYRGKIPLCVPGPPRARLTEYSAAQDKKLDW